MKRRIYDGAGTQPVARKVGAVGSTGTGETASVARSGIHAAQSANAVDAWSLPDDDLAVTGDDAAANDRPAEAGRAAQASGAADKARAKRLPAAESPAAKTTAADLRRSDRARAVTAAAPAESTAAADVSAPEAAAAAHAAASHATAPAESPAATPTPALRIGNGGERDRENERRSDAKSFCGHDFDLSPASV
jgi:hypothetical protein